MKGSRVQFWTSWVWGALSLRIAKRKSQVDKWMYGAGGQIEEYVADGNLRVIFMEMATVVADTIEIKWPRTSLEELQYLMACGEWPCSGHKEEREENQGIKEAEGHNY